jgi:hypothetical protein
MATQQAVTAPWRSLLQRSIAQNSNLPHAKYMQLATTRPDGKPAVRTVVFRYVAAQTTNSLPAYVHVSSLHP